MRLGECGLPTVTETVWRCCHNPDILELLVQAQNGFWVTARVFESDNRVCDMLDLDQGHKVHVGFMLVGLFDIGDVLDQCLGDGRWCDLAQVGGNAVVLSVSAVSAKENAEPLTRT